MKFYGKAEAVGQHILDAFRNGKIPAAMKECFWSMKNGRHSASWSLRNQIIMFLHGYSDARGFKQWLAVKRNVRQGQKAFQILAPCLIDMKDDNGQVILDANGKPRKRCIGFKDINVFGYEQTEGQPLKGREETENWVAKLPLIDLAKAWGVNVSVDAGLSLLGAAGAYSMDRDAIGLAVKNLSTWAHELVHAAEKRIRGDLENGQHLEQEVVAEFGGAILLECLGYHDDSDRGGCFEYVQHYAIRANKTPIEACMECLDRTLKAVAFILEEAEKVNAGTPEAEAVAA